MVQFHLTTLLHNIYDINYIGNGGFGFVFGGKIIVEGKRSKDCIVKLNRSYSSNEENIRNDKASFDLELSIVNDLNNIVNSVKNSPLDITL